jgi:hypothetical protein
MPMRYAARFCWRRSLAGSAGTRDVAPARMAFRVLERVSIWDINHFVAPWLARTFPYRRFADLLTDARARLGGDVARYAFIVVGSHHLHLSGPPAHQRVPQIDLFAQRFPEEISLRHRRLLTHLHLVEKCRILALMCQVPANPATPFQVQTTTVRGSADYSGATTLPGA